MTAMLAAGAPQPRILPAIHQALAAKDAVRIHDGIAFHAIGNL
jgi:hypothetical protein